MDKISYALGLSIAHNLKNAGIEKLEINSFKQAVEDIFESKETSITTNEAQQILNEYFNNLQAAKSGANKKAGEDFLAANKIRSEVTTLPSGLQYEILKKGEGKTPKLTDQVKCHYHGTLIDGTVFDSSVERGTPATFGVNQVIPGWVEALQLMPVGSKWKLYIPSNLAYGERGAGEKIQPNSALIFDVEILDIV